MAEKTTLSANEAWKRLLEKYPIAETVEQKGVYKIKADQIREFRGAPAYGQMGQL